MTHRHVGLLCLAACVAASTAIDGDEQEAVTLSTTLVERVTLHEPVVFKYVITNASSRPVAMDLGFDRLGAFEFEAIGPEARRQLGRINLREGASRTETLSVPARASYSQTGVLNEWLDFSKTGPYVITVTFRGRVQQGAALAGGLGPQAQVFSVEVLPRDEARLRAACEALFARVSTCCTQDADDAIAQLASVRDIVAVPYLEAALANARTSRFFDVLVEIGGSEVRSALERLSSSPTEWVAAGAKAALKRMR